MKPRLRAAAEVAVVHGLLGWIYVAALAAVYPNALGQHIAAILPVRRDTFGAAAFAVSALSAVSLQARTGRVWTRGGRTGPDRPSPDQPGPDQPRLDQPRLDQSRPGLTRAVLNVVVVYGLLAWAYLCVNSLTHPWSTGIQLTHFVAWPSEGSTAVFCFAASAVALFLVRSAVRAAGDGGGDGVNDSSHG
jgi:hypothetical protein